MTTEGFRLKTARLILRAFVPGDRRDILALHNDPRVTAMLIDSVPDRPEIAHIYQVWAEGLYARGEPGPLHASLADCGEFVGSFSLVRDEDSGLLELGGRLFPKYWGSGLAFEGGRALVDEAFGARGESALVSLGHPDNRAIDFVLARLGFVPRRFRDAFGKRAIEWYHDAESWSLRERQPLTRREAARIAVNRRKMRDDP
ncbi:GNAT family N-acetyltransferase [Pacificimonas sp. WHA3]|uniref:GNAT family N-acetyltransferase n=1 Tax=Pacificimonas pallii TaxID=2827236 RepID=A0ABS6SG99_9SPHN|nr:GNAT family N-acetyltransferase [Pacificimonas pallii]MBV7256946.1 GNAT family N-acetyltransferase [Pacificimonas pallii]